MWQYSHSTQSLRSTHLQLFSRRLNWAIFSIFFFTARSAPAPSGPFAVARSGTGNPSETAAFVDNYARNDILFGEEHDGGGAEVMCYVPCHSGSHQKSPIISASTSRTGSCLRGASPTAATRAIDASAINRVIYGGVGALNIKRFGIRVDSSRDYGYPRTGSHHDNPRRRLPAGRKRLWGGNMP